MLELPNDSGGDSGDAGASQTPAPSRRGHRGGGALKTGNPGNKGGLGAVPSEVRQECLDAFRDRLPRLTAIADDELTKKVGKKGKTRRVPVTPKEQRMAIVDLARIGGLATRVELDGPEGGALQVSVLLGPKAAALLPPPPPGATP